MFKSTLLDCGYPSEIVDKMWIYSDFMLEENKKYNLTGITDPKELANKHWLDSLTGEKFIEKGAKVIDIGTGAGFPGIPLKLVRGDIDLTVLDATQKKVDFVAAGAKLVGIDVKPVCGRAEEQRELFSSYDVVVTRAMASLRVLVELCTPFLRVGGKLIAYKGASAEEELLEAANALKTMNCSAELVPVELEGQTRGLVIVKKTGDAPKKYPRRYALIKKSPL